VEGFFAGVRQEIETRACGCAVAIWRALSDHAPLIEEGRSHLLLGSAIDVGCPSASCRARRIRTCRGSMRSRWRKVAERRCGADDDSGRRSPPVAAQDIARSSRRWRRSGDDLRRASRPVTCMGLFCDFLLRGMRLGRCRRRHCRHRLALRSAATLEVRSGPAGRTKALGDRDTVVADGSPPRTRSIPSPQAVQVQRDVAVDIAEPLVAGVGKGLA